MVKDSARDTAYGMLSIGVPRSAKIYVFENMWIKEKHCESY